jgi:hypothetical protein
MACAATLDLELNAHDAEFAFLVTTSIWKGGSTKEIGRSSWEEIFVGEAGRDCPR